MMKLRVIKKIAIPAAGLVFVAIAALAATSVAANSAVEGKFSLSGSAQWVVGGLKPGDMAVDLTSNCGAQVYSNTCYNSTPPFTYSDLAFKPSHPVVLSAITNLSAAYNLYGATDCSGGSPRFVIFTNGYANNYELNVGTAPYGGNCYYGWQNTGNLTNASDATLRWQVGPSGPPFYGWSAIVASHGTEQVSEIDIILDGGWIAQRGQDVTIDEFRVNNNVLQY